MIWTIIAIAWIIGSIVLYLKKRKEEPYVAHEEEFEPPPAKESRLDYNDIRRMVVGEILLRVKTEAMNPDVLEFQGSYGLEEARKKFDTEMDSHRKHLQDKKLNLESLKRILDAHGISEQWILENGEFNPKPYPSYPIYEPRTKDQYEWDSMFTKKNHDFGSPLHYPSLDKIPNHKVENMIKFKERLILKFQGPEKKVSPPPLPEPMDPDEKYRPNL